MGLVRQKDFLESLHLRVVSWLIEHHLTTQDMEAGERENKTFPVLEHCNFFHRVFPGVTVSEETAGKETLHLADIWILCFVLFFVFFPQGIQYQRGET